LFSGLSPNIIIIIIIITKAYTGEQKKTSLASAGRGIKGWMTNNSGKRLFKEINEYLY